MLSHLSRFKDSLKIDRNFKHLLLALDYPSMGNMSGSSSVPFFE